MAYDGRHRPLDSLDHVTHTLPRRWTHVYQPDAL
jgi:hypothetical protein